MESITFSTGFHLLKPGLRVSGDEISVVFKGVYDTGLYKGKKYIHIDLTNEPDLTLVEAGVSGPLDTVADVDALYTQLKDAGMTEVFEDFLVDPSDLSIIEIGNQKISFDFAGHQPYIFGRNPDPAATERIKVAHQTWTLTQTAFAGAATLFTEMESPEELEFRSIEDRLNLEAEQLDALIASGMWLFADQAAFPPAADNHGRVVHSHADGAIFFAHAGTWHQVANEADLQTAMASLASEASTRETNDDALSARLDTLEADPTTATAVAAGDAATLSSANTYTDTKVADVIGTAPGVLDTLGEIADAINDDANVYTTLVTQISDEATARENADNALDARITTIEDAPYATDAGVTIVANDLRTDFETDDATETAARITADNALSGRIDTLEADPTTQAALDAEVLARTSGDSGLDTRVTALEGNVAITDPTTATAVAAVQSDVDQNEADSDAADAALSGRLDVLEADPTTKAYVDTQDALALPKAGAVVNIGSDVTFRYGDKLIIDSAVELNLWSDGSIKVVPEEDNDILLSTQGSGKTKATNGLEVTGDLDIVGNFTGTGSFTCGSLVINSAGSFTTPVLPDNVSFADLMEAIGDALVARPKLDGTNIPGTYNNDTEAAAGGVAVGGIYKNTNGTIHWRVS